MHAGGMETQHQIKRTLSQPIVIEQIVNLLDAGGLETRTGLANRLCQDFGFYDPRGEPQLSGCLKALREFEDDGLFVLPAPSWTPVRGGPRGLATSVVPPLGVPSEVGMVVGLEMIRVETEAHMRLWNQMMMDEHPRGAGPLVGRQLRYLVGSSHGWLGGLGFGAAALQLEARDQWVGWSVEQRRASLHTMVGLSRFLIRGSVVCRNLGSFLLGMCMRVLPVDFERCYGYRPYLVESFVDISQFSGTTYRAANWIRVGQTKGRGRMDRFRETAETVKDIYLYPLVKDFREKLGVSRPIVVGPLGPGDGLDGDTWAEQEFGGAKLGDARLSKRLVEIAQAKAESPSRAFSGAVDGDWAAVKGYYRLIDKPDDSAVTLPNILAPHRERTVQRMMGQQTVLCIQDGSDLNYTSLAECEGLGVIGTNQTGAKSKGLHLHSTLAVATDGLPLGVLRARCLALEPRSPEETRPASAIPIEEKGTFSWIESFRDIASLAADMPDTQLISICDREADFFELFDEQRRHPNVELLIRAKHNRNILGGPLKLFDTLRQASVQTRVGVQIPRQSARPKLSKQKARPMRPGRTAEMDVHYERIELRPPEYHKDKEPIIVWAIHAREAVPPEQTDAVEWFLLTTIDLTSPDQAVECLRWYCLRWRIEDWHRVLKSGCRIEELANETAERLRRAIGINLVIAWRIMLMTLMGRETPELPADVLFSDIEVEVLQAYAKKRRMAPPTNLGEAVRLVARIGGYLGRKNDPPPGHQLMWIGYSQLQLMCEGYSLRGS